MISSEPKYPVYIISKGRFNNPLTAKMFLRDKVKFKIVVEPQEYEQYVQALGKDYVQVLPFSNLGLGSYPARNWCWENSIQNGFERHWLFDDNIRDMRRLHKGARIPVNSKKALIWLEEFTDRYENIGISGFNYMYFCLNDLKKPFFLNTHVYSALLIKNNIPFRWRLKYNEDVDLCLQVLTNNLCTVLFNAFNIDKTPTTTKMPGGNQTELYSNNKFEKKLLKTRSLEEIWPKYVKTVIKFRRPHHSINWKIHFKQQLIRKKSIDWQNLKNDCDNFSLIKNKQ